MSTENIDNKPQTTKKSSGIGKFFLYGSLGAAIAWLSLMIYFGNFVAINEDLYARTFMVWRNLGGDAAMFEGRYKGYKKNDFKESKEFSQFLDFAQNEDAYILTGNYPIHAPRGSEKLYTLIDEKKAVEELWKAEFNIKALLNDKKTQQDKDEWRKEAKTALKEKKYDIKFKTKWYESNPKFTSEDIKGAFDNGKNVWWQAAPKFIEILTKLSNNKKDYKFVKGSVSEELMTDITDFLKPLGYNGSEMKEKINKFFLNMATVKATPFETFAYSRLFNLYTFLTINYDFNFKRVITDDQKKEKNEIRAKERAEIFATIFSRVYEKPFNFELKEPTFMEKLTKWFGTSQNISKIEKNQDDNIKGSLEKALSNVESSTA